MCSRKIPKVEFMRFFHSLNINLPASVHANNPIEFSHPCCNGCLFQCVGLFIFSQYMRVNLFYCNLQSSVYLEQIIILH